MANDRQVVIRFKDVAVDEAVREALEQRCHRIGEEFHEVLAFDLTLKSEHDEVEAHAHVNGKNTRTAAQATGPDPRIAGDRALERLERELRTQHDKRIFAPRREARRDRSRDSG